jgi:nucleoid-associated protein YgaU
VKNFLKNLKLNEANVSMLLGIVVVVIVAGLLFNYFRSINRNSDTSSSNTDLSSDKIATDGATPKMENLPSEYTVKKGDTLWSLSESVYGSGYNWVDVYSANEKSLGKNPDALNEGMKITLPKAEVKQVTAMTSPTTMVSPSPMTTPSEPINYTVVKGDNLWNISVRTCNNGYIWSRVAKANNIANGNLIEVGQKLTISCK